MSIILNKAARLATIIMLRHQGHELTSFEISSHTGISLREAQRDIKEVEKVIRLLPIMAAKLGNKASVERTYNVNEAAQVLGLHPRHVKLLIHKLGIGHKVGQFWKFTESEIEALKNRPNARK